MIEVSAVYIIGAIITSLIDFMLLPLVMLFIIYILVEYGKLA